MRWISNNWSEGRVLDWWSGVHFISGVMLGIIIPLFGFNLFESFLITVLLVVLWEVGEVVFDVYETILNRASDILFGVLGFFIGFYVVPDGVTGFAVLIVLAVILAALEYQGWRAYMRRTGMRSD